MGHGCKTCGKILPNEKFTGKGHKNHLCKKCSNLPRDVIKRIDVREEISGYLKQSNISGKNLVRLQELFSSDNIEIAELAKIVYKVGMVKPHKKRRLKFLAQNHKDLLLKLDETGLILAHHL